MGKARLLFVEADIDIGNRMKLYFSEVDFDVYLAASGEEALEVASQALLDLIILDLMLPDIIDGLQVYRALRTNLRTSRIPVIFLIAKKHEKGENDPRLGKIEGLELEADDFIAKPFDIEELKLRVQGALRHSKRESLVDPLSGLPAGCLIEDQLRRMTRQKGWALLELGINNFEVFKNVYGMVAGDAVLRFTGMLIGEVVDKLGTNTDFIGHAGAANFIIITKEEKAGAIKAHLKERFDSEVLNYYYATDRQQGFVQVPNADGTTGKAGLMTMSIGIVSPSL